MKQQHKLVLDENGWEKNYPVLAYRFEGSIYLFHIFYTAETNEYVLGGYWNSTPYSKVKGL